ncbi:hypothetical protein ACIP88_14585 [Streptomyces uncialis]|uniref:hypothetical protein n=1 Tax=Streptomyces uncialis TaxID=1048205 RepID=UPI0037FFC79D
MLLHGAGCGEVFDGTEDDGESASAECFDLPEGDEAGEGGGDDEGEEGVFLVVQCEGGAVAGFEAGPVAVEGGAGVGDEELLDVGAGEEVAFVDEGDDGGLFARGSGRLPRRGAGR